MHLIDIFAPSYEGTTLTAHQEFHCVRHGFMMFPPQDVPNGDIVPQGLSRSRVEHITNE